MNFAKPLNLMPRINKRYLFIQLISWGFQFLPISIVNVGQPQAIPLSHAWRQYDTAEPLTIQVGTVNQVCLHTRPPSKTTTSMCNNPPSHSFDSPKVTRHHLAHWVQVVGASAEPYEFFGYQNSSFTWINKRKPSQYYHFNFIFFILLLHSPRCHKIYYFACLFVPLNLSTAIFENKSR